MLGFEASPPVLPPFPVVQSAWRSADEPFWCAPAGEQSDSESPVHWKHDGSNSSGTFGSASVVARDIFRLLPEATTSAPKGADVEPNGSLNYRL